MVAGDVTPPMSGDGVVRSPESTITASPSDFSDENVTPVPSPENYTGELICIKVKDVFGITPVCLVHTFVYTPFATFADLLYDVANKFEISFDDFELVYQSKMDVYELSVMPPGETLSAANLIPTREKEYCITISSKKRGRRGKSGRGAARNLDKAFAEAETMGDVENSSMAEKPNDQNVDSTVVDAPVMQRDFVGLKNMNMTCYLNSLLQGLWFTPEFRNLIYVFVHNAEKSSKKSICLPLQKLFLRLQFSVRESIETDELTNTFGWNSRDTWHQHDIEELCNLLMENLSKEFKTTPLEGMVEALFFGTFNDYVKCVECERRNMRDAAFLVLPLPIRQIGAPLDCPTLEEALKVFTTPELLDGNNKYNCSQCNKPCDAHKGFIFKKLPYVLTIQLKRFEYNWNTGRRYKLNDKVVFPMILNMNPYMDRSSEGIVSPSDLKPELIKASDEIMSAPARLTHSRPTIMLERPSNPEPEQQNGDSEPESSLHIGSSSESIATRLEKTYQTSGPDVYQLYAVLVHRGGLTGGHYFAYIRDFETLTWYRCDDSYVRKADIDDIEISFGGDEEDKEPASAYMLMYRRYDPNMNSLPFLFEQMPLHLQRLWHSIAEFEKRAHEEEELEKNTVRISVHHRIRGTWDMMDAEMNIPKSSTTAHAALLVYKHFFPEAPDLPLDRLRLSRFDKEKGIIENSFEGNEDQYITYILRNPVPVTKNDGLILEVLEKDESFFTYSPSDLVFFTQVVDYMKEELREVDEVHASASNTVEQLKDNIAKKLHLEKDMLSIVLQATDQTTHSLEFDWSVLRDLELQHINFIFVEAVPPDEIHGLATFVNNYIHTILFELEIELPLQEQSQGSELTIKAEVAKENVEQSFNDHNHSAFANKCINEDDSSDHGIHMSSGNGSNPNEVRPLDTSRKFIMQVKDKRSSGQWSKCMLRADGRMPLWTFSAHISNIINLSEAHFIMYKIDKDEEIELLRLKETINEILPFDKLRIALGHRLNCNEGRLSVYLLDLNDASENSRFIGFVVLNPNMSVNEAKEVVLTQCWDSINHLDRTKFRLRKRNQSTPSKVFRDGKKVFDYFNYTSIHRSELYLQKMEATQSLEEHCYPIIIRRWKPSDFSLDPPFEIMIFHDHSVSVERVILNKLVECLDLSEEDIEVAKPSGNYPYQLNAMAIQDLTWFPLTSTAKKSLYVYHDELTLFARDKTENAKRITVEEEEQLRLENEGNSGTVYTGTYGLSPPKKETGLKIDLASSP